MKNKQNIQRWLIVFIVLLVLSGLTAFPLHAETTFMMAHLDWFPSFFHQWIHVVDSAVHQASPLMHYGTDWLAFAHIVIALFFIPVYIDPVAYRLTVRMGQVACLLVIPLALICGPLRGIPFFHQIIDCCFGIVGFATLQWVYSGIQQLMRLEKDPTLNLL